MTVQEVETRKAQLETLRDTALDAAKTLIPATAEFDEAYGRYLSAKASLAGIPAELAKALMAQNSEAIKVAGIQLADGITEMIAGLNIAALLGTPVVALRYYRIPSKDAEGKESISQGVVFNPTTQAKAAGIKSKGESKGAGHTQIVGPDGTKQSLTKFVMAHMSKPAGLGEKAWYPHTEVDSNPKFDVFCVAHNLVGYAYQLPGKVEEPAS